MSLQSSGFYIKAATISELLSESFDSDLIQTPNFEQADHRLTAWCQSAANGDWNKFDARLAREGLTRDFVRQRFATARAVENKPLAQWLTDSLWIREALLPSSIPSHGSREQPASAEALFAKLVGEAHNKLLEQVGPERCVLFSRRRSR